MLHQFRRYQYLIQRVANWQVYIWYKLGIRRPDELTFALRSAGPVALTAHVPRRMLQTFKEIFLGNDYLEHARLPADPVVIDIGANVGYFSLLVLNLYPSAKVFAYEPMPQNFRLLQRHVQSNPGVSLKAENKAVFSSTQPLKLKFDAKDEFTTSASISGSPSEADTIEVGCTTLADIFRGEGLSRIDLLKLDCEGSEYAILYSLPEEFFGRIRNIALEAHAGHGENENIGGLTRFLQTKGFQTRPKGDLLAAWR